MDKAGSRGVGERIRDEGLKLGMKAVSLLVVDPARAEVLVGALHKVQAGRDNLEQVTGRLRNLAVLPSRTDLQDLGKRVGRLRREAKKLKGRLEDLADRLPG